MPVTNVPKNIFIYSAQTKRISAAKLLGRDDGSLGKVGEGSDKAGALPRIVRHNMMRISANEKALKSLKPEELSNNVGGIEDRVDSIVETLKEQHKLEKDKIKDARKDAQDKKRSLKERLLEGSTNIWDGVKKTVGTVFKPFKNIWDKIVGFIQTLILGNIITRIFKWLGDEQNQGKIENILKFFEDWWPTMLAAYLLFGTSFGKMATAMVVTVGKFIVKLLALIPKLLAAIAKLKIGKILKMVPGGGMLKKAAPLVLSLGGGMLIEKGLSGDLSGGGDGSGDGDGDGSGDGDGDGDGNKNPELKFATGGFVSGPGGVDKVPARLTAGEFVMSKGAVQKYGVNTLAGMNAAAGGTNKPTMGRFNQGGFANITNTMTTSSSDSDGNFSMGLNYIGPEEAKVFLADRGLPSMQLMDGTVVPDFGNMAESKMRVGLQLTKDMAVQNQASPEVIAQIDQLMADPNAQPGVVANIINQIIPGSWDNTLMNLGDDISLNVKQFNGGGLVPIPEFAGGGFVGRWGAKRRMGVVEPSRTNKLLSSNKQSPSLGPPNKGDPSTVIADMRKQQLQTPGASTKGPVSTEMPKFNVVCQAASSNRANKMSVLGITV